MHMVLGAIDQDRLTLDPLQNNRHVGMKASTDLPVPKKRRAVFRAEDDMDNDSCERLWHVRQIIAPLWGLARTLFRTQGGARASLCPGLASLGPLALGCPAGLF
jgi:hypothetical protein